MPVFKIFALAPDVLGAWGGKLSGGKMSYTRSSSSSHEESLQR